jgi:hypothetical protein
MTNADKKERVASALLDLTDRERLTWEQFRPDAAELPDDLPAAADSSVFAALHDEMDLYLYQEAEGDAADPTPRLEVTDPESGAGWTVPEMDVVEELYDLVQFRAAGLEDWMDRVIAEAEGTASGEDASGEEALDEDTPGDAEDSVPPWADDTTEGDGESPPSGESAGEDEPSKDSFDSDEDDGPAPDVFGNGNGTADEKELG